MERCVLYWEVMVGFTAIIEQLEKIKLMMFQRFRWDLKSTDLQRSKKNWDRLQMGEMKYNNPGRQVQTNPKMVDFEILFYSVFQSQLRCFEFCLKLLYTL